MKKTTLIVMILFCFSSQVFAGVRAECIEKAEHLTYEDKQKSFYGSLDYGVTTIASEFEKSPAYTIELRKEADGRTIATLTKPALNLWSGVQVASATLSDIHKYQSLEVKSGWEVGIGLYCDLILEN
jgi:hypothetical protein